MSSGSAHDSLSSGDKKDRDALDGMLSQGLRQPRGPRPRTITQTSSPAPSLPEEDLLRYVDGTLDQKAHAEVEACLLQDPLAREQVAVLKAALLELAQPPPAGAGPSRFVVWLCEDGLRFLRGPTPPLPSGSPPQCILLQTRFGGTLADLRLVPSGGAVQMEVSMHMNGRSDVRIALLRNGQPLGGGAPDHQGRLCFEGLTAARYEIQAQVGVEVLDRLHLQLK